MLKTLYFTLCAVYLTLAHSFASTNQKNTTTHELYTQHKEFVSNFANSTINILSNKETPITVRRTQFKQAIQQHFATRSIARFVVARYWRRMPQPQQIKYVNLFIDAMVYTYSSHFDSYNNEKLIIKSTTPTKDKGVVINSAIVDSHTGNEIEIKWKVFNTKRGLKIVDVKINNISMGITLRSEYTEIIRNGNINSLLNYLKKKTDNLYNTSATQEKTNITPLDTKAS